jgi:hypothetical protein
VGLAAMVFSAMSAAAGAILYWVATHQGHGFRLSTLGLVLMIAGAAGYVVSSTVFGASRQSFGTNYNSPLLHVDGVDGQGQPNSEHEETR